MPSPPPHAGRPAGYPHRRWLLRLLVSLAVAWFCAHGFAAGRWPFLPAASRVLAGQMAAFLVFPSVAYLAFVTRCPIRGLGLCAALGLIALGAGFTL